MGWLFPSDKEIKLKYPRIRRVQYDRVVFQDMAAAISKNMKNLFFSLYPPALRQGDASCSSACRNQTRAASSRTTEIISNISISGGKTGYPDTPNHPPNPLLQPPGYSAAAPCSFSRLVCLVSRAHHHIPLPYEEISCVGFIHHSAGEVIFGITNNILFCSSSPGAGCTLFQNKITKH
eukprot:768605-Hanusia_phi.AAC.2